MNRCPECDNPFCYECGGIHHDTECSHYEESPECVEDQDEEEDDGDEDDDVAEIHATASAGA